MKTKLTELLGVVHPIVCGGMHFVGYAELAAAVSNAGGLGMITALTQTSPEELRKEIRKCKALTSKPFAVNLTLLPALAPPDYPAYAQVVVDEGVKIVETAGRSPDQFISFFKQHKIIVIHKCVTIKHALSAQKLGVDILSMDGFDCAGHPGEFDIGNWILLAKAGKVLTTPFIASGGVGTGSQLAAALALGACGVNMGTRFMCTQEAFIHANIKKAMVEADESQTTLIMRSVNNTERVYKNATALKVREIEEKFPGDFSKIGPFVKGMNYKKSFQETGDTQDSVWSCGPVIGLIDDVPTCKVLLQRMVDEAESSIKSMHSKL